MICISINQESRRLALVDMLNAARQCDLLEIRLDRFGKAPEIAELMTHKPKPVIMACRRPQDGGFFDGTEPERLAILRQCIISKADYVEIELDAADDIRRFPPSQRVISYTNLRETPVDILDIYEEAKTKSPDVIKLTTLARTPEEAWPLVQILAKATVPTVVVGLGKPGIMLTLLGQRIGAPWTYAALERGMEAYPGQPTVGDLESVYHLHKIDKQTRFVGVTGFEDRATIAVAALNAALAHHQLNFRCLPMGVGNMKLFRKVMEAVKLGAAVIDPEHQRDILEIGPELHGTAKTVGAVDLLIQKQNAWHGFHCASQAWMEALTATLRQKFSVENPIKDRMVMIAGLTPATKILATEVQRLGGNAILASHQKKAALALAQELSCRAIGFDALYTTMHDVLILCDEERQSSGRDAGIHPGYFKPGMVVMDLTATAGSSQLLIDAQVRNCLTVDPLQLLLARLGAQAKLLTGKPTPDDVLRQAIPERFLEVG
ncbi:MAG: type I 3-dehydroquinate dehydratase [Gemmataceae bacterium]